MATIEEILQRETRALVFDLYGTVVDMQSGLTAAVTPFLKKKGWDGDPSSFVTWWRRTHFEDSMIDGLLDRGHTPYRQIGHRAVSQVMDRCGIKHTQDEVTWLVSQIELLKPFPDVIAALNQLKTRYKLVILSNGDRDMLENARPHIGFPFDRFISVQEARPMPRPKRSSMPSGRTSSAPASSSSPITPSTASAQSHTASARSSSIAASARSASRRTNPT